MDGRRGGWTVKPSFDAGTHLKNKNDVYAEIEKEPIAVENGESPEI